MKSPKQRSPMVAFKVSPEEHRNIRTLCAMSGKDYYDLVMPLLREEMKRNKLLRIVREETKKTAAC